MAGRTMRAKLGPYKRHKNMPSRHRHGQRTHEAQRGKTMKTANCIFFFRQAAAMPGESPATQAVGASPSANRVPTLNRLRNLGRQSLASALMICLAPLSIGDIYAQQDTPPPPPPDYGGQQGSAYAPLPPQELNRLVAPIALYPDALVAQVLAASTYPAQVASAEQFVQQNGGAPPQQLAEMANQQPWDPSVKALTAFPQVLANLNQNMQWTTQLGNAYYNQPQDVMNAVQAMRQQAYAAGNLRPSQQLDVVYQPGAIVIEPVNPAVVYVPYYNPWVVYGAPIAPWGYYHYYGPPAGVALGVGLAIGFGVGVAIGAFGHFGWGYHNWAPNWGSRTVVFNHTTYISNSVTVVNHGNYGAFDRNPQARAFNHTQAAQFANVNHTTINNVSVNRTNVNNNFNRTNVNSFNNRGAAPNAAANFNPRTQQNFNRGAQPGQFNGGARPAAQPGQFNAGARPAQAPQFNGGARPGPAAPSFRSSTPAPQYHAAAPQYHAPAAQQHYSAPKPAAQHAQPQHESHSGGHGEHH